MPRALGSYPAWMFQVLKDLQSGTEGGVRYARFESESECGAQRLQFYKFLRALGDEEVEHPLAGIAREIEVKWVKEPGTRSKRILVIGKERANPLVAGADIAEALEKERIMSEMHKEMGARERAGTGAGMLTPAQIEALKKKHGH